MSTNEIDKVVEHLYNSKLSSKEEIRRNIKLLLNASGTTIEDTKNEIIDRVRYSTTKKELNGEEVISIDDVIDIVNNV